ncbi:CCHC-type domain-containing protein [Trichonephila clavipes]|nr:CCHC-type domain-containing protein [Trichonephila clavipes]
MKRTCMPNFKAIIHEGYETSAMSRTWALYLIGLHPEVQEKIHEESDKVFGEDIDRDATEEDLNELNYLNCVLMEPPVKRIIPEFGLLKKIVGRKDKNANRARSQARCSNTFVTAMEEPIDLPRERLGETLSNGLKEYDRVANFNKWDDMMCLANVYFFLDGTARQWYVNNEDALDSWEAFKNGLSGLFGDRQKYTRRAEEQLKCRAQRSGESTQSYIQSVLGLCQENKSSDERIRKSVTLMKGVAEDIYQALLTREINDTASFIKWCNYIEDMKQKRVGRPRFERLPNVVPVASLTDETDLVSLIRTIVREEVHRLVNQTQESLDLDPQSLEEIVQDEVERVLAPVSTKPTETRPRPTYAAVTRKYRAPVQKFPPEPRKTDVWRTADNRPVCFHCGRPGHVMRYCRERKRLSLTTLETADGTSTTLALKKKYADQTLLAVLRQVPREADPQYVVTDPRRHIADPVSRQAVGARKTKESDLPRR